MPDEFARASLMLVRVLVLDDEIFVSYRAYTVHRLAIVSVNSLASAERRSVLLSVRSCSSHKEYHSSERCTRRMDSVRIGSE